MATAPDRVVVAGDWHGNTDWAVGVIEQLPQLLPDEPHPLVLHAGDFGVWPGHTGRAYLDAVSAALARVNGTLRFVDGNHEDHNRLVLYLAGDPHRDRPIQMQGSPDAPWRCWWLPRGARWTWHGRTWLALGGAVSVDRAHRRPGRDWWPREQIDADDITVATSGGPADVMLTHDCPAAVPLKLPVPSRSWAQIDLDEAQLHRQRLQHVVDVVRPSHLIHGHYHPYYHRTTVEMAHGPVEVTGLDCDDTLSGGNYAVLNVRDMTWARTALTSDNR